MGDEEKPLPWTDEEIVMHYRAAKDKAAIIPILADLNAVTPARIKRVLGRNGIKTDAEHRAQGKYQTVRDEKPIVRKKETKPRKPKVFIVLEHGGVDYSVDDIVRRIGRSPTYIKARLVNVDAVTFGGIEYRITRYEKWGKNRGHQNEVSSDFLGGERNEHE